MAFKDRLKEARINKKLTQEELAGKVGIAKSTVTGYEKGNSEPSMLMIQKIMNVLEVDANYLWQDEMEDATELIITLNERRHIEKYRSLDQYGKKIIDTILDIEIERVKSDETASTKELVDNEYHESKISTKLLQYYNRLASAGTGQIVFDSPPTNIIRIPDTDKFKKASYAIGVNGDSMQPTFCDGDILVIEMTDDIRIGEIGIFWVKGDCFVKKLGNGELISINHEYKNIPLTEEDRCMGRVLGRL